MASSGAARYVPVQVDYIAGLTAAAALIGVGGREVWVPKSVIHECCKPLVRSGEPEELQVQDWFAKKEGLI